MATGDDRAGSGRVWERTERGRNPLTLAGLLLCCALLACGVLVGAPAIWLAAALLPILALLAMVLRNPTRRTRIDNDGIGFTGDGMDDVFVPLDRIDFMEIVEWSDGTDVSLVLKDGRTVAVPDALRPRWQDLRAELAARGIEVCIR